MREIRKDGSVGVEECWCWKDDSHTGKDLLGFRKYHVRKPLTLTSCEMGEVGQTSNSELANRLASIPGVEKAFICPYEITIFKAEMFEWEEIEPEVLLYIKAFLETI
jgi:hypothetical protein